MRTVLLEEVSAELAAQSGAIYITDGTFAELIRRDLGMSPFYADATTPVARSEDLHITVDRVAKESFMAAQDHLRRQGLLGGFEEIPGWLKAASPREQPY